LCASGEVMKMYCFHTFSFAATQKYMKVTYYGHACFGVEVGGKNLLFDPFISGNELAKNIDINSIPADVIFVTHGHFDHIADAVAIANRTGALVISNWEVCDWLQKQGLTQCHPMNTGGKRKWDFGTVRCTVAQHSSSLPDGSYGGNPVGFILETEEGNFYYSGDTALTLDMQLIPNWSKLDFALLPIGDNFTMGYEDAVVAADFIKCNKIIGLHFDTFGYIVVDRDKAIKAFSDAGKELILMPIGENISL
jgi:L-ascorbate metabolism protein UlaG (beta-lactamase superfamily)